VCAGPEGEGSIGTVGESLVPMAAIVGVVLVAMAAIVVLYARSYVKVEPGHALVVTKPGRIEVSFDAALVLPLVHRAETIDLRTQTVVIERRGKRGLVCRDGVRADVVARFFVRIQATAEDVGRVATSLGCARASDPAGLQALFEGKFTEALATVAAALDFEHLHRERERFRDQVVEVIGRDISGFVLDDLALEHLEQTPLEQLDPHDILDAQGIRTITERTTRETIRSHELRLDAERQRLRVDHELQDLVIELERRKADALARFRESTGRELTEDQLRVRLEDELRRVIERVLAERPRGAGEPARAAPAEARAEARA